MALDADLDEQHRREDVRDFLEEIQPLAEIALGTVVNLSCELNDGSLWGTRRERVPGLVLAAELDFVDKTEDRERAAIVGKQLRHLLHDLIVTSSKAIPPQINAHYGYTGCDLLGTGANRDEDG